MFSKITSLLLLKTFLCHAYPPMENPNLFEGDMVLTPDQVNRIKNSNGFAATKNPWPRVIPYDLFALKYETKARKSILDAFTEFHRFTCLRFIPRTTERSYIAFDNGNGCSSSVGYEPGRVNHISFGEQCWKKGIAIHEIMHSLGFHHEQSRPDRDNYIKVHIENALEYATNNFLKYGYDKVDSLGEPYDFESVMHYKGDTFAKHGKLAITTLDPSKQKLIGQRNSLSKIDIIQINKLYKCKDAIPMTIPVLPTLDPNCSDVYAHCDKYKHYCDPSQVGALKKWVLQNCKSTCKICGSPTKPSLRH